jgi:1-aminocyclopropane-1-carboxylate deaminase/D-cysteine desulfhydrase-like pyridoxal-dependent ACC family enzyme
MVRLGRPSSIVATPVERAGDPPLWIKRDDRIAEPYGGNKVRKLERLLDQARAEGKSRLLTLGAAGSHQVVATAIYGRAQGFEVDAVLVPQPGTAHARTNLRVALGHGLRAHAAPAWSVAPAVVATKLGRDTFFIPLGGSNVVGSLGYVDAGRELAAQITAGDLPEPDVVVVALGSGGTAAGLAVAFEEARLRTRVIGVAVSHPARVLSVMAHRLTRETAKAIGVSTRAAQRLEVDRRWVGRGYGFFTHEAQAAIADAVAMGVELDPTYTAKAFACALARVRAGGERVLFWHTLSTWPLEPLLADAPDELPASLARLLK